MSTVAEIAFVMLAIAAALQLIRLVRAESLADRIVALDLLLLTVVSGLAVDAARTGKGTFVDVLAVTALLGFTGTITVARFIERRGAR